MAHILVSGLLNTETTVAVEGFPIPYFPITYPEFAVNTRVSGVGYNLTKALTTLGDSVRLCSLVGDDPSARLIRRELETLGVADSGVLAGLSQTPSSVVLYEPGGRRQIYCDLKDIQKVGYPFEASVCRGIDLAAVCNIGFNRPLLKRLKAAGVPIATDVHVLRDLYDGYNREFLEAADIVFLSDEGVWPDFRAFITALGDVYHCELVVLGRGSRGAAMYWRKRNWIYEFPAVDLGPVVNTVGAGDALFSAFLHHYTAGLDPVEAVQRAQVFAAAKIRTSGAAQGFVTAAELEDLCEQVKEQGNWQAL